MGNTKHTPGPWRVVGDPPIKFDIEADCGACVAIVDVPNDANRAEADEAEANARLMAAAPELAEALAACLPDLKHYAATHGPGPDKRLETALAAMAKAGLL